MKYKNLRDFLELLEKQGELKRLHGNRPYLEMTKIADRTLRAGEILILFENPKAVKFLCFVIYLVLPNVLLLLGMGQEDVTALRDVGRLLAFLKNLNNQKSFKDLWSKSSSI